MEILDRLGTIICSRHTFFHGVC